MGKSGNQHTKTQEEINQILVDQAREVGCAFESGRGWRAGRPRYGGGRWDGDCGEIEGGGSVCVWARGEEGEYLRRGGAVCGGAGDYVGDCGPAYAGIPVTHRDFTSTITLITGHEREKSDKVEVRSQKSRKEERG